MMRGKKSSSKRLYWQDAVNRQARSGLSIRQFCAKEGVSEPSFYAWRRELEARDRKREEAEEVVSHPATSQEFVPLKLIDVPATLEIVHPLGVQVRITGSVDRAALTEVLDLLDERGRR